MFVGLTNTPRDYAWGDTSAMADLLERTPSGLPEAEYWLGTHPSSPTMLTGDREPHGTSRLSELTRLPFLLKVLAAAAPLSLQAHPTLEQAREGFDRENALGIPLDSPIRNYRDAMHKPELIYALSPDFSALCGFRPVAATRALLERLGPDAVVDTLRDRLVDDSSLRPVFEWLISRTPGVDELVARVVERSRAVPAPEFEVVGQLSAAYPGDPGIVIALLLNLVVLHAGQVLYLPAGNIHAYLRGLGIELMAASDNVLRGGLTPKHVDVPELLRVLDFRPTPVPFLEPVEPSPGVTVFRPAVPDFQLAVIQTSDATARFSPVEESIALCTAGAVTITGSVGAVSLAKGESVYVTSDESPLVFTGTGTVFVASSGVSGRRNEKNL